MSLATDREIATTASPLVPFELIQSIIVSELIRPSRHLWISSPWISDIEVIDNRARQFSMLGPDWPPARIRLSAVLAVLLAHGSRVTIVTNADDHNQAFRATLEPLRAAYPEQLTLLVDAHLHEKGIVGELFGLSGSMNLTFNGVFVNQEHVIYTCDPARVAERRLSFEQRWGDQP
jgi:hypothetical protein